MNEEQQELERYSVIPDKNPREIVLLRGRGCAWKKCTFCDYHLDYSKDEEENYQLNVRELEKVTGDYHNLEVINSGSFPELDEKTMEKIVEVCQEKQIKILHFESHWIYRKKFLPYREKFKGLGIDLKIRLGVESFDYSYRESYMNKGIDAKTPMEIAEYFDEVCLLQGLTGQTVESMKNDIETGLQYFERVFVNIMVPNSTDILPDKNVVKQFLDFVYPIYKDNQRVDILLDNTDFGVGGVVEDE